MHSQGTRWQTGANETRSAVPGKAPPRLPGSAHDAYCLRDRVGDPRPGVSVLRLPLLWRVLTGLSLALVLLAMIVAALVTVIGTSG
jgi:hypothetical protein